MSNHEDLITQFKEISGCDNSTANFYLESSNWSLEEALSNYLGNQADNEMAEIPQTVTVGNANAQSASAFEDKTSNQQNDNGSNFGKKPYKSKIATLNDMSQRSSDEEEGQAFYAGGSERSGQQVLGPPKRKNFREQLSDMFRMAQEQGNLSEPSSTSTSSRPSSSSGITWGQGVRLGQTDNDHTVVNPNGDSKRESLQKKPVVILKLWSQGFSINDGELRLYDDPENKEFLETVMRGEIPNELLEMGWMVNVDVEDHRHEDYKKKATEVKTFKGAGQTLGSPVPNIQEDPVIAPPNEASSSKSPEENEKLAIERLKLDSTKSTTSLQIRLADGSRLMAQFNNTHTVGDIREYIQTARPQYANRNFVLVSSFPTRELTEDSATIASAGLENASIMQRLK